MKQITILLIATMILGCSSFSGNETGIDSGSNQLTGKNTSLIDSLKGSWVNEIASSPDGRRNFSYLNLRSNGKGEIGFVSEYENEFQIIDFLTFDISYWRIIDEKVLELNYCTFDGPPISYYWKIHKVGKHRFVKAPYFLNNEPINVTDTFNRIQRVLERK